MNHMIHIAAATQIRLDTPGRAYYRRKLAAGKTRAEAMRCLKRRISDALSASWSPTPSRGQASSRGGPGRAPRGVTSIQRGRLAPAHRHFGSATSRTRTTTLPADPSEEDQRQQAPRTRLLTDRGVNALIAASKGVLCGRSAISRRIANRAVISHGR